MVAPAPPLPLVRRVAAEFFPPDPSLAVERATEGGSTFVYRIVRGDERFYLRVLPEHGASFAPEARTHELLRRIGVLVPEVMAYEHCHPVLGLSVMLTTEIAGEPLSRLMEGWARADILQAAGRDLAKINSLPVAGFGWIRRDAPVVTMLTAELPTNRAFLLGELEDDLALLARRGLSGDECATIARTTGRFATMLETSQGWLAHGDFDPTHIYSRDGRYTGIIDFGEMREAAQTYDLGHFALRAWEADRHSDLDALLAGYAAVSPLPTDMKQRIALDALLIWLRSTARLLRKREGVMLEVDAARGARYALSQLRR